MEIIFCLFRDPYKTYKYSCVSENQIFSNVEPRNVF